MNKYSIVILSVAVVYFLVGLALVANHTSAGLPEFYGNSIPIVGLVAGIASLVLGGLAASRRRHFRTVVLVTVGLILLVLVYFLAISV